MDALLEAYQLLGLMVVLGIQFSVNVWTILIHKHCQLGILDVANKLLQNMLHTGCSPNVVTYTTLIKAYMESNRVTDASNLFNHMRSAGHTPDLVLWNVLIDCHSKAGRHQDALGVFRSLSKQNIQPDPYTLTSWLSMICQSRMFDLLPKPALVFRYIDPDLVFCNALLSYLVKAGHPSDAAEFYDLMIELGFAPDKYSFAVLLSALCAAGKIYEAVKVYRGGVMSSQETDARIHTVIIVELIKAGKYLMAATVFKQAVVRKYPLDNVAYAVGICALLRSGRTPDACTFYDQMKENGLKPNAHTCNMMLFTFYKEKDLQKVNQMLKEMIGSRIELSDRNFLNLCNFPCRSDAYYSTSNLLAEMREMGLLPAKALHALSSDKYAESLEEKYEHCAEVNTELNLVLDSSSSEDLSDVAASVG
ncbi:putative pentatricopeptide repeat-containing protein At1g16830 isoform X2 [Lotus japonicus]|nr:putative pentatricopeptide repeat-containing protein At1g16830 isoform X2 [Lotus japonicus]